MLKPIGNIISVFVVIYGIFTVQAQTQAPVKAGFIWSGAEDAMIWRQGQWQEDIEPLAKIYVGDSVKVEQVADSKVILKLKGIDEPVELKFGSRTYFVSTPVPATIDTLKTQNIKPKDRPIRLLLREILEAFIDDDAIPLRPATSRRSLSKLISPNQTYVLSSQRNMQFEWHSGRINSYSLVIKDDETGKPLFSQNDFRDTVLVLKPRQFRIQVGRSYRWSVSNSSFGNDSTAFRVATYSDEQQIKRLLNRIADNYAGDDFISQRIIIQAICLWKKEYYYDARRLLYDAVQAQPENSELKKLLKYTEP